MPARPQRRDTAALRRTWLRSRRAEVQFGRKLRSLARRCGELTQQMFDPDDFLGSTTRIRILLRNYATTLRPWAQAVAKSMVLDVKRRDEAFWAEQAKSMARNLKAEIANAPIGLTLRERTQEAAAYITSLPLEAAQRVEQLAVEALTNSSRASELAKKILATGEVTKSRANLIARTEVSRTAGILVQTRAQSVGSEGFVWRTAGDIDVRERHRKLAGKYFRWDSLPVAGENGERAAPGGIYNCRCYAEIVLPGEERRFIAEAA